MNWRFRYISVVSALAVSTVFTGCDSIAEVTQPLAPNAESLARGGIHGELTLIDVDESVGGDASPVYRLIGPEGGSVGNGVFRLDIPRKAVAEQTLFVIGAAEELPGKLAVEATATACSASDAETCYDQLTAGDLSSNDVGDAGFRVPITLSVGFEPADGRNIWAGVKMVWIRPDNVLVPIPTNVLLAKREIRGHTDHLSMYGLAWP